MASELPPEILSHILKLSVPSALVSGPRERLTNLCRYARVSRKWRREAQFLLFQDATVVTDPTGKKSEKFVTVLEGKEEGFSVKHLRVHALIDIGRGPSGSDRPELPIGISAFLQSMTSMTLSRIEIHPDLLVGLPELQNLSLSSVKFTSLTPSSTSSLPRLTDLSLSELKSHLPTCLLPAQLPALQRLVTYHCALPASETDNLKYYLQHALDLQHQLSYFGGDKVNPMLSTGDATSLADIALITTQLSELDQTGFRNSLIRHLKINDTDSLADGAEEEEYDDSWTLGDLKRLFHVECPKLETLVIPRQWREVTSFHSVRLLAEQKKTVLLVEEETTGVENKLLKENRISPVFKEYRSRTFSRQ